MGSGASAGIRAAVQVASVRDLRQALSSLSDEHREKLERVLAANGSTSTQMDVRLPEKAANSGRVVLSPFDRLNMGRAIPMVWFYEETVDCPKLLAALEQTLAAYPVLCGRYSSPPTAVELNNSGVPVQICKKDVTEASLLEATARLPVSANQTTPCMFSTRAHAEFVPTGGDGCGPDIPLLSIKITLFATGGTAIGMLMSHGVVDADTQITFARNWSRTFRGLPLDPPPIHERCIVNDLSTGDLTAGEKPNGLKVVAISPGEEYVPAFMGVLPTISGSQACVVPIPRQALHDMRAAAVAELQKDQFVSADDVVTARIWRALCSMRCTQLGYPFDADLPTTATRACNIRGRTDPQLGSGYCGNGVTNISTESTVGELLGMSISTLARRLRTDLQTHGSPAHIAAAARWLHKTQEAQCSAKAVHDTHGLTFVISSWGFDWEGANFNAAPRCFDHGAILPIVAVILPRPNGDGVNVYASGPQESMDQFARLLT